MVGDEDLHDYRDCGRPGSWSSAVLSIVIAAFCGGLSALFFAEFASRIPSTGGILVTSMPSLESFPPGLPVG